VESRTGLPHYDRFQPNETVPEAVDFTAVICVSGEDMEKFQVLYLGSDAIGLQGFRQQPRRSQVLERIHWTLQIDLLWVSMDPQPIYVETEIIVDEATVRYVYMLMPVLGDGDAVDRVHVVTKPVLGATKALEEMF
jgi:hypothetical protein